MRPRVFSSTSMILKSKIVVSSTQFIGRHLSTSVRPHQQPYHNSAITTAKQHTLRASIKVNLNAWQQMAIQKLLEEQKHCPETPIYLLAKIHGVEIFAKNECAQPTGSHKHRLARSLLLYALSNGLIDQHTHLVEASSGGTACSEAYFAKLLGLSYTAVVPKGTPQNKLDAVTEHHGRVVECVPGEDKTVAAELGRQSGWYFIDQFANAGLASDPEKNIASELTEQFRKHDIAMPDYVVCGAGTGGASATLGGYFQQHGYVKTKVIVGDPANSSFYLAFKTGNMNVTTGISSRIGGIGRPRVEPAFDLKKIAEVISVPDAASIAACHFLQCVFGLHAGGSTGTNLFTCFELIERMHRNNEKGSILMFIFDRGKLYENTYYNPEWLKEQNIDIQPYLNHMLNFYYNYSDKKPILQDLSLHSSLATTIVHRNFKP